jgi:hypothetical protein
MSATQALRNLWYTEQHNYITKSLIIKADKFKKEKGYPPPYWELVALAESIKVQQDSN